MHRAPRTGPPGHEIQHPRRRGPDPPFSAEPVHHPQRRKTTQMRWCRPPVVTAEERGLDIEPPVRGEPVSAHDVVVFEGCAVSSATCRPPAGSCTPATNPIRHAGTPHPSYARTRQEYLLVGRRSGTIELHDLPRVGQAGDGFGTILGRSDNTTHHPVGDTDPVERVQMLSQRSAPLPVSVKMICVQKPRIHRTCLSCLMPGMKGRRTGMIARRPGLTQSVL